MPPFPTAPRNAAFSLVEVLVAMAVLAIIMTMMASMTGSVTKAWSRSENRVETHQSARAALEIMAREMTPAVVDTRMQFAIFPGSLLEEKGALHIAENSPAIAWMSPLGERGDLRCVGYYLFRDPARKFYRLKRIYISPDNKDGYFPKLYNPENSRDPSMRTSPTQAEWLMRGWDKDAFDEEDPANDKAVAAAAADGIAAFWVQPIDLLGNPIPWLSNSPNHPKSKLIYNSAAYFSAATTLPFDGGKSFLYLAKTPQVMKGNRVPSAVDLTVFTIDERILAKGFDIPLQENIMAGDGSLDVAASIDAYRDALAAANIRDARAFTTRVKLINGS
jgi:prepilin-type N-terminal cleavage/methylation domain-containing protein